MYLLVSTSLTNRFDRSFGLNNLSPPQENGRPPTTLSFIDGKSKHLYPTCCSPRLTFTRKSKQDKYYWAQFLQKEHPNLQKNADTQNHHAPHNLVRNCTQLRPNFLRISYPSFVSGSYQSLLKSLPFKFKYYFNLVLCE
jgi:hypothetical protein